MSVEKKYCTKCGALIGSKDSFCRECGGAVNQSTEEPESNRNPATTKEITQSSKSSNSKIQPGLIQTVVGTVIFILTLMGSYRRSQSLFYDPNYIDLNPFLMIICVIIVIFGINKMRKNK